ncbi:stage II sporulation protein R [Paenibacillus marinisediminis]
MQIKKVIKAVMLGSILAGAVMSWGTVVLAGSNGNINESARVYVNAAEDSKNNQAGADIIPTDAIRLRILANSDSDEDQAVKREVRDRVVELMNGWLEDGNVPSTRDEARVLIETNLEQLQRVANDVLESAGISYKAVAELKVVPFPAKLYGGRVYPAGDYEALRITLGVGEGQNWWCVLFPPLCFVDGTQGTATAKAETGADGDEQKEKAGKADQDGSSKESTASNNAEDSASADNSDQTEREVRFFLWDMLVAIGEWFQAMFTAIFG